jgi:hypothetical protein
MKRKGSDWSNTFEAAWFNEGSFDQKFYVIATKRTANNELSRSLIYIRASSDQDFIQFRSQFELLYPSDSILGVGLIRLQGVKSNENVNIQRAFMDLSNNRVAKIGAYRLDNSDSLTMLYRILDDLKLPVGAEFKVEYPEVSGPVIQVQTSGGPAVLFEHP